MLLFAGTVALYASAHVGWRAAAAAALVFTVNSTADGHDAFPGNNICETAPGNGLCTLRAAIEEVDVRNNGADSIVINIPPADPGCSGGSICTIVPATNFPAILVGVSITGPGSRFLIIDGSTAGRRIFLIATNPANQTVNLSGLTMINGAGLDGTPAGGGAIRNQSSVVNITNCVLSNSNGPSGGAVYSSGTLSVTSSVISSNFSSRGGAVYNDGGSLTVTSSQINNNSATTPGLAGGAIYNAAAGVTTVTNSTLSSNIATNSSGSGGAIVNDTNGIVRLSNSTITRNSTQSSGGGVVNAGTSFTVKSSIIALNIGPAPAPDVSGNFSSQGFNLIGKTDGSTGFSAGTDQTGTNAFPLDPMLDPAGLQNHGGPTLTIALLYGSPAVDKGSSVPITGPALTTDQRGTGFPRTADDPALANASGGDGTDIGAFELPPPAIVPGWSLVGSPQVTEQQINNLTCVSASLCWAVGSFFSGPTNTTKQRTLIEQWNGSSWSVIRSPNTSTTQINSLSGVGCASATQCWAVGAYSNDSSIAQALIEHWDGASWSIVAANTSTTVNNSLNQVACNSAADCWAIGSINNSTLIEHWNGSAWSVIASPNFLGSQFNSLMDLTCNSTTDCWAVGNYSTPTPDQTLIEHWDGNAWSIVASPNTSTSLDNVFLSVSCVSTSDCTAVGAAKNATNYQTLIEHWNGTAWSIVSNTPNTSSAQDNILYRVKCTSASDCSAAGYYFASSGFPQSLMEHWNGSAWSIVPSPNASPANYVYGLACSSASNCWAAGYFQTASVDQALMLRWNGVSWSLFDSTNGGAASTQQTNLLNAATCASGNDCWAVGYYDSGGFEQSLIEHWNGLSWAILTAPNTDLSQNNYLAGAACASSTNCWAVGNYQNGSAPNQTLIEHWDGTSWSILPSPNTSAAQINGLFGVACLSASDCFAVGLSVNASNIDQTLILRWNGNNWSIVTSPNIGANDNALNGVTCVGGSECWAVGYYLNGSIDQALIEKWDGTSWSVFSAPDTSSAQNNILTSVSCPAVSQCWAAGYYTSGTTSHTLIDQWTSTSATALTPPNIDATHNNLLNSITCTSASACWAVGFDIGSSGNDVPLIEQWDGNAWTIVPSRPGSLANNQFNAVTCPSAANCWAIGDTFGGTPNIYQTLINEYSPSVPPVAAAFSRKVHGNAGPFDVTLPVSGAIGIECRNGGGNSIVFSFVNDVTNCGTSGSGTVVAGPNPNQCTVNLNGAPANMQYTTIDLLNAVDALNGAGNVAVQMGVLLGDVNGNGVVTNADVSLVKSQVAAGGNVTASNFRNDVNANGVITNADVSIVKAQVALGAQLP